MIGFLCLKSIPSYQPLVSCKKILRPGATCWTSKAVQVDLAVRERLKDSDWGVGMLNPLQWAKDDVSSPVFFLREGLID